MKNLIKMIALAGAMSISLTALAAEPVVDAAWVKAHSCDGNVRVLDVRNPLDGSSKTDYLKGHIPCAVHTNYLKDGWRSTVNNVPAQLSNPDDLAKIIGGLGIDNDTHVVISHNGKNALDMGSATRIYWTFKVLGHDRVSILNGGYRGYTSDPGNEIEKGNNKPEPKTFTVSLRPEMIATKEDVKMAIDDVSTVLVDIRPTHQFLGINRHPRSKRFGTVPSAKSFPESWATNNGGGSFRSAADLKQLYAAAGLETGGKQINFCNTGHWASLGWFVSHELLGNQEATMYDGSMVEWSADESLPIYRQVTLE